MKFKELFQKLINKQQTYFVDIDDVIITNTLPPEKRWFWHFIALTLAYFSIGRLFRAFRRFFTSKIPEFESIPVFKRDNRYKIRQRVIKYKFEVSGYRKMTNDELKIHKRQQAARFFKSLLVIIGSVAYLMHLYLS